MEIQPHHSHTHLTAAAIAADHVREIEYEFQDETVNSPGEYEELAAGQEHHSMAISSIISSYSYVEAVINEMNGLIEEDSTVGWFMSANAELSNRNFTDYETLSKYQAVLAAADIEKFARGEAPFQEVKWLRQLRNYWIHYEPSSITEESPETNESNLESALRDRVDSNPLYDGENERYLPRMAMSYDCCVWSIRSATTFVDEFRNRIGDSRSDRGNPIVRSILDTEY